MFLRILKTKKGKWAVALVAIAIFAVVGSIENLPVAVVLFIVSGILFAYSAKSIQKQPRTSSQEIIDNTGQEIKLTISTTTTAHADEYFIAKGENVSLLDLGGYRSPSGGYVNWAQYRVTGKNTATGRKNTRQYTARDENSVTEVAEADGLAPPYEVRVIPNEMPTDRQITYLRSWNVDVPTGAVKSDVSAILSRLEESYDVVTERKTTSNSVVRYVRPLPGPSEEFAKYADDMGVMFSRYIGQDALFNNTVYSLNDREKTAFFAYCVLCSHYHKNIGDLRTSEYASKLYSFADVALENKTLMRSIGGRPTDDYKRPHKGSAAYKAVSEFFALK